MPAGTSLERCSPPVPSNPASLVHPHATAATLSPHWSCLAPSLNQTLSKLFSTPLQIINTVQAAERGSGLVVPRPDALPAGPLDQYPAYVALMEACWERDPARRPGFEEVAARLRAILVTGALAHVALPFHCGCPQWTVRLGAALNLPRVPCGCRSGSTNNSGTEPLPQSPTALLAEVRRNSSGAIPSPLNISTAPSTQPSSQPSGLPSRQASRHLPPGDTAAAVGGVRGSNNTASAESGFSFDAASSGGFGAGRQHGSADAPMSSPFAASAGAAASPFAAAETDVVASPFAAAAGVPPPQ